MKKITNLIIKGLLLSYQMDSLSFGSFFSDKYRNWKNYKKPKL